MELSCKSEYALLALMALSDHFQDDEPMQIRQIATQQSIPDRYLEQLLASLRRAGLVRSLRGSKGGYLLAREPWQITVWEVMNCIEGRDIAALKGYESGETTEKKVIKAAWQEACAAICQVLQNQTLQDLCNHRDAQKQSELMYYI